MTDEERAALQQKLTEAEAALHERLVGHSVASAGYDGKNVTYRALSVEELRAYILELKSQLGLGRGRRPLRGNFNQSC